MIAQKFRIMQIAGLNLGLETDYPDANISLVS